MKKVYIIHGWESSPTEPWIVWVQNQLASKGFAVRALQMPQPDPVIGEWIGKLQETVKSPNENTYFIGHSIGGQAVMRYLAALPEGTKIGGAIFLAGWFDLNNLEDEESEEIARPWLETPIDFESLKKKSNKYVAILSDNDKWVPLDITKEKFEENLGAKVIVEHNKGHFSEDTGVTEVPSVVAELLRISDS